MRNNRDTRTSNRRTDRTSRRQEKSGSAPVRSYSVNTSSEVYIRVAVWKNVVDGENGEFVTFNVTWEKRYKKGDEWRNTTSLRAGEIPALQSLLQLAFQFCVEAKADEAQNDD